MRFCLLAERRGVGTPPRKPSGMMGLRAVWTEILFSHEEQQQGFVRRNPPGWVVGKMREKVDS